MIPKFKTAYSDADLCPSPVGEQIYKWEYVTEDGEIVEESRNFFEMIQSSERQTDYKELIQKYGVDNESVTGCTGGIYGDVEQFGSDSDSFNERVSALIKGLEQAIIDARQGQTVSATGAESAQDTAQAVKAK